MTVNGKRADAEQVQREMDRLDRLVAVQAAEIERLRATLKKVKRECDALMKLKEGETERDLTGYARGSYFAAKHLKACAALEDKP